VLVSDMGIVLLCGLLTGVYKTEVSSALNAGVHG